MSMYRQLWLAIITSTILALVGSLLASTLSARSYLEDQLRTKNQDNASALALSMSQSKPDAITAEVTVAALFDSGHYELIKITDPMGNTIAERKAPTIVSGVPAWLVLALPIKSEPGKAQISNGWRQFGNVTLQSQSKFAYQSLWRTMLALTGAMSIAGLIGGFLGSLILKRLKKPLDQVIDQARAITERRFITMPEPAVPELHQLAHAMNTVVKQLKSMFQDEAARLEIMRKEANCDPLTGIANRNFFIAQLRNELENDEQDGGTVILIRVADLANINHQLGRAATDDLLKRIGLSISKFGINLNNDSLAARLNGADFALLLAGQKSVNGHQLLQNLIHDTESFFENGPSAFVALGEYHQKMDMTALLSQLDIALASAEATGTNSIQETKLSDETNSPTNHEDWGRMIENALTQGWVKLVDYPVNKLDGSLLHRECPLRLKLLPHGEWEPAGKLLPMAERLKLTSHIDLAAVNLGLNHLRNDTSQSDLAINLSASSIENATFRYELVKLIESHPECNHRLWLEIGENGAFKHFDAFKQLCLSLHRTGCKLGLEHFGRQFSQIGLLHDLGLDYIKIDSSFIRGIDENIGNQAFLKGLSAIAHNIGLQVIAEGVNNQSEFQILTSLGFDAATGPAIK